MGNAVMCDCHPCRKKRPKGPKAKDDGATGEHLCNNCLRRPSCKNHPMNNPSEDLPEDEIQYANVK